MQLTQAQKLIGSGLVSVEGNSCSINYSLIILVPRAFGPSYPEAPWYEQKVTLVMQDLNCYIFTYSKLFSFQRHPLVDR